MRGTHDVIAFHALRPGIIPAYAGNTTNISTPSNCARDHPRVCGEHVLVSSGISVISGSSPRMRGTPLRGFRRHVEAGIIPAYAGNTCDVSNHIHGCRDHPRVCGEHYAVKDSMADYTGSSPRMRGTHGQFAVRVAIGGIIPAYAGNTT